MFLPSVAQVIPVVLTVSSGLTYFGKHGRHDSEGLLPSPIWPTSLRVK